jgi:hypothetical protein
MNIKRRQLRKRPPLSTGQVDKLFGWWLDGALRDEAWRAFIQARLRQQDLPVIRLDAMEAG